MFAARITYRRKSNSAIFELRSARDFVKSERPPKINRSTLMKKNLLLGFMLVAANSLFAADSTPKNDVTAAANALGNQKNYSWETTTEVGNNSRFKPGPTDGKTEKDGYTSLKMSFGDNATEAVLKGTNGAIKLQDKDWQTLAEASQDDGGGGFNPGMFMARMLQNYKMPAAEAASFASEAQNLKTGTNGISGDLTEDGAKALLAFRRGGNNGGDGPTVTNPKGSVTFWITDGKLTKYQTHVTGTVSFNGNDRDVDRTTTTEIKDIGSTKVDVSDDAKKKLQ
jgi:hypothetical protein